MNKNVEQILERYLQEVNTNLTQEEIVEKLTSVILSQQPNLILLTDAYKYSHPNIYTKGLTYLTSYMESRGGKFEYTIFSGLQPMIKKYLLGRVLTEEMVYDKTKQQEITDDLISIIHHFSSKMYSSRKRKKITDTIKSEEC